MVPPRNQTAVEGSQVQFDCEVDGYPNNITHRWYHNGVEVRAVEDGGSQRAVVLSNGSLIVNVTSIADDGGWYSCRPTNAIGEAPEAKAFLNITCK